VRTNIVIRTYYILIAGFHLLVVSVPRMGKSLSITYRNVNKAEYYILIFHKS